MTYHWCGTCDTYTWWARTPVEQFLLDLVHRFIHRGGSK